MHRLVLGLVLLAACGGPTRDATEVTIAGHAAPPPPSAAPAPVGALDATLPANAAAKLILDPIVVKRAATGMLTHADGSASNEEHALEEALGVGAGAAGGDRILDTLGIDPSRPIAIAMAHLDAGGQARVARLEAVAAKLGRTTSDSLRVDPSELLRAFGTEPAFARLRVRVPVQDAGAAKRALRRLLTKADLRESAAPPGVDLVMSSRSVTVAIASDAAWVVVDLYIESGDGGRPRPDVLASIRSLRADGERGDEPAPLGDLWARATLVPTKIAEIGFVNQIQATMGALASVSADQLSRLAATGLVEAHRSIELAGNERGNYFRQVTLELHPSGGVALLDAFGDFGGAFEASGRAATRARSDAHVVFDGAHGYLDAPVAFGLAFPLPGDGHGGPAEELAFVRIVRDAGWPGWPIALPLAPLYLATMPLRPPPDAFEPTSAALKLERVAFVDPSPHTGELLVGLLRGGASAAEASCVLHGTTPCAKHALRVDAAAVKMGAKFARVAKAGDRFVVVIGDDVAGVDAFQPVVAHGLTFWLDGRLPADAMRGPPSALLFGSRTAPRLRVRGDSLGDRLGIALEQIP